MAWYEKTRDLLFGKSETFEGDTLHPLMYWSTIIIRLKLHKAFAKIVLLFTVLYILLFIWYILKVEPVTDLISYVPFQLIQGHILVSYVLLLTSQSRVKKMSRMLKLFKLLANASVGSRGKVLQRINRESKMITNVMYLSFMMAYLALFLLNPTNNSKSFHFVIMLATKYFPPSLTTITAVVYLVFCFHAIYNVLAPGFMLAYYTMHLQFQVLLLQKALKLIGKGYNLYGLDSAGNDAYQQDVKRQLRACVIHHELIKRVFNELNGIVYVPLIFYIIFGAIIAGAVLILLLNNPGNFGLILLLAVTALFNFITSWFGQKLVNESEEIYRCATRCPWHLWNKENRQILQLLLIHSKVPLTMSTSNIATLDNRTIIKFVKAIYSIITFYQSLQSLSA